MQRESPNYDKHKVDSELTIGFGGLIVNWKPQCVIYLVQFLNTQSNVVKEHKKPVQAAPNMNVLVEESERGRDQAVSVDTKQLKNCKEKRETQLKVNLKLSFMRAQFIHPQNHTYPIFSLKLEGLQLGYDKKYDHDSIMMKIQNFQIYDNLNYPKTLSPFDEYSKDEKLIENEIMGVNTKQGGDAMMLDLQMVMFTYPGETGCCPEQPSKQYNMKMKVEMSQLKLVFMQEQTMRMLDYIFYQVSALIQKNTKDDDAPTIDITKIIPSQKVIDWESFNLDQTRQGPSMMINIHSPVIIIPNLANEKDYFMIDLGKIIVDSTIQNEKGRWVNYPGKQMFTTNYLVRMRDMKFDYYSGEAPVDTIWNEDTLDIIVTMVNPSEHFKEQGQELRASQRFQNFQFDLNQVDLSMKVDIQLKVFEVKLEQTTFIALCDILANNVSFNDVHSKHFKVSLVTQADATVQKKVTPKSTEHRKSMELLIHSSCLSLVMRDFNSVLITEVCIVGFEFAQVSYLSGASVMSVQAGTMFMFHDEYEESHMKQVMMGHKDAMAEVFTSDDFYEKMPLEFIRKIESNKDSANFKYRQEYTANGDSEMNIELCQVKMYVRQHVFTQMSQFLIHGLEKMQKPQTQDEDIVVVVQEKKPTTATSKMTIKIIDTLMLMENLEVGKRCIALQMSLDVLMQSMDPKQLRQVLPPNKTKVWSLTKVDVHNLAALFCNVDDVSENGYQMAEKRDILQPLECHLNWEISLKNDFPVRMINTSMMTFDMDDAILKLSIDDLYTVKAISDKQNADLAALSKVWADNGAKSKPKEEPPKPQDQTADKDLASTFFNSKKVEILLINENDGAYVPLFYFNLDGIMYTAQSDSDTQTSGQYVELQVAFDYFNPNSGCYEPVIEQFPLMYKTLQVGKNSDIKIQLVQAICMNVTVDLATNIAVFNRLWAQSTETAVKFKKRQDEQKTSSQKTSLFQSKSILKSTSLHKSKSMKSSKLDPTFSSQISHATAVKQLTIKEQIQKLASPYAIRNMTTQPLKVFQIDRMGNLEFTEHENVQSYETKKLVQLSSKRQKDKDSSKSFASNAEMDLFIKLQFSSDDMRPVQRLNLNKNNSMTYYNVWKAADREPLVLQSKLEDNRRVLTVRSQFVMRNQTKLQYHVRIFYVDTATDQVVIVLDKRLDPDESMPLPDHVNPEIRQKIKIAIRPSKCRKWSQEFKLQRMKTTIQPEVNVVWQHNETYSILRKLPTSLDGCYDMVLQPPVIIKSCLPCRVTVDLSGKQEWPKHMSKPVDNQESAQIQIQNVVLEKQEERQLLEMKKFNGDLVLTIDLGEQFKTSEICLLPDQAKEGDFPIKIFDKKGCSFQIMARVDTKKAGLWIVFYCENLLICRTIQQLAFYYNKKTGGDFPSPIVNKPGEKVMYIFENCKEIYSLLGGNRDSQFSDKIQIGAAGNIGDFCVCLAGKDSKKQFNFAYQSAVWSVSETEFISTKIVEITPQFILINQTDHQIIFSQDLKEAPQTRLEPHSRLVYHWDDRTSQLLKFKPYHQQQHNFSPAFSLKDVGTIFVCCQSPQSNMYFRVTKRMVAQSVFCVVEEAEHAPYTIRNNLTDITLTAQQACIKEQDQFKIQPLEERSYAWSHFDQNEFQLQVTFSKSDTGAAMRSTTQDKGLVQLLGQHQESALKFFLDDLNEQHCVELSVQSKSVKVYVSTYRDTNCKVIEFTDEPSSKITQERKDSMANIITEEETKEQKSKKKSGHIFDGKDKALMTLEIAQINISCINKGVEVFTIFLHDLQVKQATSDTDQVLESYLGRFQIDNNQELDTLYPVMMKPKCLEVEREHDHLKMLGVDPVFQFYVHTKLNVSNVTYYEIVEWLVKELEVKVELDHIYGIMEWVFAFQAQMNSSLTSISPFFKAAVVSEDGEVQEFQIKSWTDEEIVKTDENTVYIKSYKGSPLCLELSLFKQTLVEDEEVKTQQPSHTQSSTIGSKIANMGIKLTSLNNAPIKLDALEITNVYGSQTDITNQLTSHYYGNIKVNIVRVLASSDLIGNPYNVVNSLGTGVKKFYYEPRNGFMEGPLQGGLGILKGTAGMVGIVGASTVGSIGKVTNSINKGILAVSLDKDYIHKKEIDDIKHKPTGVLSGMGEGVKGFGTSVFSGVTGVVTKPIEGATKGGVTGFFKGAGIGILGLAIKPVTGVVDLVSKTTQGIETQATGTPDCPQNCQRMRLPRPFYRDLNIVKRYNTVHAKVFNQIRDKNKVSQPFLGAYKCGAGQTDTKDSNIELGTEVLVVMSDTLIAMAPDLSIVLQIPLADIQSTVFENQLELQPKMIIRYMSDHKDKSGKPKGKTISKTREFAFTGLEQYEECKEVVVEMQQTMKKLDQ